MGYNPPKYKVLKVRKTKHRKGRRSLTHDVLVFSLSFAAFLGSSFLTYTILRSPDMAIMDILINLRTNEAVVSNQEDAKQAERNPTAGGPEKNGPDRSAESAQREALMGECYKNINDMLVRRNQPGSQVAEVQYCIQVIAFNSSERAQKFKEDLKQTKDLDCDLVKSKGMTIVTCGCFPTRKAAERNNKKISQFVGWQCMVMKRG